MPDLFFYSVVTVDSLTEKVTRILLQADRLPGLSYQAGQYVLIHHQQEQIPFSIACAPNSHYSLEFHMYHPAHNVLANALLHTARQEKKWQISGPMGVCTVDKLTLHEPLIFIAYGTGFAPIKAMLEVLLNLPQIPFIHFYWAMPHAGDFYLLDIIHEWQRQQARFTYTPIVLAGEKKWHPLIVDEYVLRDYPDLSRHQVYLAAPKAFILTALQAFTEHGLSREKIFSDLLP